MIFRLRYLVVLFSLFFFAFSCAKQSRLIPFEKEHVWGYKNKKGEVVVAPQYLVADDFLPEGIAAVLDRSGWSYIDKKGKEVIRPFVVDNGPDSFQEGLARFVKDKKFGFFNRKGERVIEPLFDFAFPFQEGFAVVCRGCSKKYIGEHYRVEGGKWGYIDTSGKIVIPLEFDEAQGFEKGYALVKEGGRWLRINRQGEQE